MLKSSKHQKYSRLLAFLIVLGLESCAYYNTFYNAEEYFAEAQKLTRENQTESVTREEINLYSKAIEKSKKLLTSFPESKYRDDAQFIIAKSYYFKGDYLLAKRYFEDLSSLYSNSPHTSEVPVWLGRCLLKTNDLEMAQYEASRVLKNNTDRGLQSDALLLMGEIAVKQDSLKLAESYLEQVIDRSSDSFTKAQAQFQVGKMRENEKNFNGALKAYKTVSKFKPSESLKVEAIIRQTSMLKALNRDDDAVEMIQDMLVSDKFVDIRGELELELGKLYLVMDEVDKAESKFESIVEEYNRTDVSAEASYYLGELYLTKRLDYENAKEAFKDVKIQSTRSPQVKAALQRNKQIDRYVQIQLDYKNLQRQLAGLPPVTQVKKKANTSRSRTSSRGRARGTRNRTPDQETTAQNFTGEAPETIDTVAVSADDSLRFSKLMDENRYSLAEYMLFEFTRIDTTLEILADLESSTRDSSIQHQCAYMRYYAIGTIAGDEEGGQLALQEIQRKYPHYYETIMDKETSSENTTSPDDERFAGISQFFDTGDYQLASNKYYAMREDSTVSTRLRAKASFNHAWLNDNYLYDKDSAVESYNYLVTHFSSDPLAKTARTRLSILNQEPTGGAESSQEVETGEKSEDQEQDSQVSTAPEMEETDK